MSIKEKNKNKKICQANIVKKIYNIFIILVDAFAALGGNIDSSGYVSRNTILEILSSEFEMLFDIDDLLERIEVSNDELDFDTFRRLFKVSDDPKALSKASSVLSVIKIILFYII